MRFTRTFEINENSFTVEFEAFNVRFNHSPREPWNAAAIEDFDVVILSVEPDVGHPIAREIVRERLIDKIKDDSAVIALLEDDAAVEMSEK